MPRDKKSSFLLAKGMNWLGQEPFACHLGSSLGNYSSISRISWINSPENELIHLKVKRFIFRMLE